MKKRRGKRPNLRWQHNSIQAIMHMGCCSSADRRPLVQRRAKVKTEGGLRIDTFELADIRQDPPLGPDGAPNPKVCRVCHFSPALSRALPPSLPPPLSLSRSLARSPTRPSQLTVFTAQTSMPLKGKSSKKKAEAKSRGLPSTDANAGQPEKPAPRNVFSFLPGQVHSANFCGCMRPR